MNAANVARTLNCLTDRAFTEALSARDSDAMTQLIQDYFCGDEGMHFLKYCVIIFITRNVMSRTSNFQVSFVSDSLHWNSLQTAFYSKMIHSLTALSMRMITQISQVTIRHCKEREKVWNGKMEVRGGERRKRD